MLPWPARMALDQRHFPAARAQALGRRRSRPCRRRSRWRGVPDRRERGRGLRLAKRAPLPSNTKPCAASAATCSCVEPVACRRASTGGQARQAAREAGPGPQAVQLDEIDARRQLGQRRVERRVEQVERDAGVRLRDAVEARQQAVGQATMCRRADVRDRCARRRSARAARAVAVGACRRPCSASRPCQKREGFTPLPRGGSRRIVVVDHADALHVGVDDGRADELEAAFAQVFRDAVGQSVLVGRVPSGQSLTSGCRRRRPTGSGRASALLAQAR
jgi:hypothetical protein